MLNISWDKQWKTKDDYLTWLEAIVKECQRVLKYNGSFYMFASADMSWHVEGLVRKYFNALNHIRWIDKQSVANKTLTVVIPWLIHLRCAMPLIASH